MIKMFKYAAAVMALTASTGFAAGEPWTQGAPKGTSGTHQQMAAQASKVHSQVGQAGFGENPMSVKWKNSGDRNQESPLSNVSASALQAAITGRYHVYQDPGQTKWSVRYYAADGTTHFCHAGGRGNHVEEKQHYAVTTSRFGLAGILHWGSTKSKPTGTNAYSWPLVVDSNSGEVAIFNYHNRHWKAQLGWIQSEYAPAFAENCPKLPRVSAVSSQTGDTLAEMARGARPVKVQPAFAGSTRSPLTAGMYYHFNPPAR